MDLLEDLYAPVLNGQKSLFNLTVTNVSHHDTVNTSDLSNLFNITPQFQLTVVFTATHLLSNQKNTNLPEPAISQELITRFSNLAANLHKLSA
jgi:hypothetical protein